MAEEIQFVFDGKLATNHQMSFYEFARFQYSASRLFVKLDNFRRTGRFPKRITFENQHSITVKPFRDGSFGLDLLAPLAMEGARLAYEIPLSVLFAYVVERVFKPAGDDVVREVLASQRHLVDRFDANIERRDDTIARTLDMLRDEMSQNREVNELNRDLFERLTAETERRAYLEGQRDQLRRFTAEQDAELVTMAAPLLKEMNVPLRESARRVSIRRREGENVIQLLCANRKMADEVDLAVVDPHITTIDVNIVQYNKENGWGKFRNLEWDGLPSFNIPAEINVDIKDQILASMNQPLVEVDCFFVRSPAGIPLRIILIDVREIDDLDL